MTQAGANTPTRRSPGRRAFSPPRFQAEPHFAVMSDAAITRVQIWTVTFERTLDQATFIGVTGSTG